MKNALHRKRILQVNIDNDGGNGAFALVRYLYSFLKNEYVFDYFTMGKFIEDSVYKDILSDGGKCYSADLRSNKLLGHIILPFNFYKFLKKNKYDIVHIHSEVAYKHYLYAIGANLAGVKKIIIHSHSNNIDGNNKGIKFLFHKILRNRVNRLGTDFLACSEPAAEWMFDKKTLKSNHFKLLHNGIAPHSYKFSEVIRNEKRSSLTITNEIILGHVGALKKVKNQERLLDILNDINNPQYKLLLIGDGEDRQKLENKAKSLGIIDQVIFLGSRTDVAELLQAIDVFVFPSLFEGIPMALIEAQAVGLPIVASDRINKDIQINDNITFCPLEESNKYWIDAIYKSELSHMKLAGNNNVQSSYYNIQNSSESLKKVYSYD